MIPDKEKMIEFTGSHSAALTAVAVMYNKHKGKIPAFDAEDPEWRWA